MAETTGKHSFCVLLLTTLAFAAAAAEPATFHSPDSQLTALQDQLLSGNPRLRAADQYTASGFARIPQQRALPDPQLSYRLYASPPETRVGPQRQGIEVSQALPWPGKRKLQAERAEHTADGMSWRTRDLARTLIAELKRDYFDAAYLQEAMEINAEETDLLRRFEQIALTRYSTGDGNQQNVIKAQTDITRLSDGRTSLERRLAAVERRIARLIGRPGTRLTLARIDLDLIRLQYDAHLLEQEAVDNNPGVFAARAQVDAGRAWVDRRQRDRYPDFSMALGYTDVGRRNDAAALAAPPQDNGQDIWSVAVKFNLPVNRGRIRAGVAEAESNLLGSRESMRETQNQVRTEVQEALLRLEAAAERASLYRDVLIPQAEQTLSSAEAAYTTNSRSFLDLLDAQRVLFQVRLTYHRLLSDYWISLAEVERAIARPFPAEEDRP